MARSPTSFREKHVPSDRSRSNHTATMMTKVQADRLNAGRRESTPSDYRRFKTPQDEQLREVRRKIEDRQMMKDLGLDPEAI